MRCSWHEKVTCWCVGLDKQETPKRSPWFSPLRGLLWPLPGREAEEWAVPPFPSSGGVCTRILYMFAVPGSMAFVPLIEPDLATVLNFSDPFSVLLGQTRRNKNKKEENESRDSYQFLIASNLHFPIWPSRLSVIRLRITCLGLHHKYAENICSRFVSILQTCTPSSRLWTVFPLRSPLLCQAQSKPHCLWDALGGKGA